MAIKKIEGVKIDGRNQAFGGYIYNVDAQIGFGATPTKITVNFLNEDGKYIEPILSATTPYHISIGNILSGSFYAISYRETSSRSGKLFAVSFWDGSIALDRLWVGLHKRMGDKDKNTNQHLILVGTERHPCDINQDGVYDILDINELGYEEITNCELICPGEEDPLQKLIENCNERGVVEMFDVDYSFADLLAALNGKIALGVSPSINTNFRAKYCGKLRDVLSSWCSDFGWTFYWEDEKLNFLDTSSQPTIDFDVVGCLQSVVKEKTIEGTIARGLITHYGERGIVSSKSCDYSRPFNLSCLTLKDLYGDYYFPTFMEGHDSTSESTDTSPVSKSPPTPSKEIYLDEKYPNGVPIGMFELSCCLSRYGEDLRNYFNFYYYYGIQDAAKAQEYVGKTLHRYGAMKVMKVFNPDSSNDVICSEIQDLFFKIDDSPGASNKERATLTKLQLESFKKKNGFYMLVKMDLQKLKSLYEQEQYLANEFIGRHWVRAYKDIHYGVTPQVTGGAQYISGLSNESIDLPFSKFRATRGSKVANLFATFAKKQKLKLRNYKSNSGIDPNTQKPLVKSLLYFQKNAVWNPSNDLDSAINKILQTDGKTIPIIRDAKKFLFEIANKGALDKFGFKNKEEFIKGNYNIQNAENGYYLLAIFPNSLNVTTSQEDNPYEEEPTYIPDPTKASSDMRIGLTSKVCKKITIDGATLYTPVASLYNSSSSIFAWEDSKVLSSNPQYVVAVTSTTSGAGIIPKMESTLTTAANLNNECASVEYVVKELTRESMRYITNLLPTCRFDSALLTEAHNKLHDKLIFNVNGPLETRKYSIVGVVIPKGIKIKDGLQEVQVRIDEKGIVTDIGLGNTKFIPPSQEYLTRELEFSQYSQMTNARNNPI